MFGKFIKALDLGMAQVLPKGGPGDDLTVLAFHSVLEQLEDLALQLIDPYQPITLADVDAVIRHFRGLGYRFVTGRDLAQAPGQEPAVWLTFDDGYANNLALLPLLQRHGVPATIFVASHHIETGEAYWWDVLYREGMRRNANTAELARRRESLKQLAPAAIRSALIEQFGVQALRPEGTLDRPMTPGELAALAAEPLIEIGNHTHHHAILTVVSPQARHQEIRRCQDSLTAITGRVPVAIAFPNGNVDAGVLTAAEAEGLLIGVTCLPCRTRLQDLGAGPANLAIGRFAGLRNGRIEREISLALAPFGISLARASARTRYLAQLAVPPV